VDEVELAGGATTAVTAGVGRGVVAAPAVAAVTVTAAAPAAVTAARTACQRGTAGDCDSLQDTTPSDRLVIRCHSRYIETSTIYNLAF
jgi:hypothetical protein